MKKLLLIGLAFFIVLVGCDLVSRDFYRAEDDFPEDGKGMLVLILDSSGVSKTIDPADPITGDPTILLVASYNISGTRTEGGSFEEDVPVAGVYTKNDLEPGEWTITVKAWNGHSPSVQIGTGQTTVDILPNELKLANIKVFPETGKGGLFLKISWPVDSVPLAKVDAFLVDPQGGSHEISSDSPTATDPCFEVSIADDWATYDKPLTGVGWPGGYYKITLELFRDPGTGPEKVTGVSESIRIITGYTTNHTWSLAGLELTIEEDFKDPIGITISGINYDTGPDPDELTAIATLTSGVPTDPAPDSYDYEWYVDGVSVGSNSDNLLASGTIQPGSHNLSVIVTAKFNAEPDIVSSQTEPFTVP